ncbi:MAG: hypothetical protein WED15_06540 [Akkermansiaceae bacterium]
MKTPSTSPTRRGSSLIEAVIAMGVLAVAIPLGFAALAESGRSGMSARAETRSSWIIPACLYEIRASRAGRPQYFSATTTGQEFPADDELWALAFSPEGRPLGKLSQALYNKGTRELDGQIIGYIATLSATIPTPPTTEPVPLLRARISLEYPPTAPSTKRQKLDFYSRIP